MEFVASLSHGRTAAAQCGLFTHKSVPVIFEPPCISGTIGSKFWIKKGHILGPSIDVPRVGECFVLR